MNKKIGLAFLLILIIALVAWLVTLYIQPVLPEETNIYMYFAVVAVLGAAGFLASLKDTIELVQNYQEHNARRLLNEEFSRGPYDKATIERSTRYYIRPKYFKFHLQFINLRRKPGY